LRHIQGARGQRRRDQDTSTRAAASTANNLPIEDPAKQQHDRRGRCEGNGCLAPAQRRIDRSVLTPRSCTRAHDRPQQQHGRRGQQRGVKHILRIDDALHAQREAWQVAGLV